MSRRGVSEGEDPAGAAGDDGSGDSAGAAPGTGGRPVIRVISDPLCAWAWGMAPAVARTRAELDGEVRFRLHCAGLGVGATAPPGDDATARHRALRDRVAAVTGQDFGSRLPGRRGFVYTSEPACRAIEAVRSLTGEEPFAFLERLQAAFFLDAADVTSDAVLAELAGDCGIDAGAFTEALADPAIAERTAAGFRCSRGQGASALPAVLVEGRKGVQLFAAGYCPEDLLIPDLRDWLRKHGAA